jgi:Flp pilus assembly pilin Flp
VKLTKCAMAIVEIAAVIVMTMAWRKTGDAVMCYLFWITCFIVLVGSVRQWNWSWALIAIGLASNAIVTLWNNGVMPVVGMPRTMYAYFPIWSGNGRMLLLADRATLDYFSPGDLLMILGVLLLVCRKGGVMFKRLWREQEGQDIAEYAVMLAVILVIVIGTVRLIGSNANNVFQNVASSIGSGNIQ